jgi:hypothetical protein
MGLKLLERDYLAKIFASRQEYTTQRHEHLTQYRNDILNKLSNEIALFQGLRAYLEMKAAEAISSRKRYYFKKRIQFETEQFEKKKRESEAPEQIEKVKRELEAVKRELEAPYPLDVNSYLKPVEMKILGIECVVKLSVSNYEESIALLDKQQQEPQLLRASLNKCENKVKISRGKASYYAEEKQTAIAESVRKSVSESKFYVYKCSLYLFDQYDIHSEDEQKLLVKGDYFKRNKKFASLRKEMALFEKLSSGNIESREPIPQDVRFAVWRRDEGKCVLCGSNQNLEFDHIIPVSKGGSSTERNIQLLCEKCNREKSNKI